MPDPQFVTVLGRLRTFLVHHIDTRQPRNEKTERTCIEWFESACGSAVPHSLDE
ncbi:hypothetical protein OOK27_27460 [Streptomyces canus]|uniref:hypothetical protein n=1 Tax=Streptomyces canus TaxID=58343 RepID=UPI002259D8CA|nr:hypothetical protein [Streptomyces canus]MCX5257812.1 hypothetical protein [Streptomyces canus]